LHPTFATATPINLKHTGASCALRVSLATTKPLAFLALRAAIAGRVRAFEKRIILPLYSLLVFFAFMCSE
jgi:hypothetical protein